MEISQPRNAFRELFFKLASEDGKLEAKELKEFISELSRTGTSFPNKFNVHVLKFGNVMYDRYKFIFLV